MTIQGFRDYMASGRPIEGGSEVHLMFHKLSQEALQITAEINGKYHTPEELHDLLRDALGARRASKRRDVAAGTVVTKEVTPNTVVGGFPAKVIKKIEV